MQERAQVNKSCIDSNENKDFNVKATRDYFSNLQANLT